ncbi:sensor domain-containing diguanylate cyclase [Ectobacillus ponti]|uniref:Sensor domain-containing diguanylate cyclase n=1 Tax=Ectobacillus ponti TaxID=2961894 RepID=A0AA41X6I7_9BACI|nr:sensor domain-containing diguanylate cyclase [Ectobacillus ponti]
MDARLKFAPCGYLSLADDGSILALNETLLEWLGYPLSDLQGKHVDTILSAPGRLFYQVYFFPLIRMHGTVKEMYLSLQARSGKSIPVLINAVRKEYDGILSNECIFTNMTQRYEFEQGLLAAKKSAEEATRSKNEAIAALESLKKDLEDKQQELLKLNAQLQILAKTDELTGLQNRRSFQESLADNIELFNRTNRPFSLLLLDVDHFKQINDTFGHSTGDFVLKQIAQVLMQSCRKIDTAARYGGEEFAMVLPDTDQDGAAAAAERVRSMVEASCWIEMPITISIGITTMLPGDQERQLLSRADQGLYTSKEMGRNRITHSAHLQAGS